MFGVCVCKVMVERQHVTPQVGTVPRGVDPGPGEESFLLWSASGKSCGASSKADFPWRFLKFFRIPPFSFQRQCLLPHQNFESILLCMMGTLPVKNYFLEAYIAFLLFNFVLEIFGRKHNG